MNIMKYIKYMGALLICLDTYGMEPELCYRQATMHDLSGLRYLMENAAQTNAREMFIPPILFRDEYLAKKVEQRCMYIATTKNGDPVACAKLRVVADDHERADLLASELALVGDDACYTTHQNAPLAMRNLGDTTILERGTEYTLPEYRGKGINGKLFACGFDHVLGHIHGDAKKRHAQFLALTYGLVAHNGHRAPGMNKQFFAMVAKHGLSDASDPVLVQSYAQKPGCRPDAQQFELDPSLMVPGFGNFCSVRLQP